MSNRIIISCSSIRSRHSGIIMCRSSRRSRRRGCSRISRTIAFYLSLFILLLPLPVAILASIHHSSLDVAAMVDRVVCSFEAGLLSVLADEGVAQGQAVSIGASP